MDIISRTNDMDTIESVACVAGSSFFGKRAFCGYVSEPSSFNWHKHHFHQTTYPKHQNKLLTV